MYSIKKYQSIRKVQDQSVQRLLETKKNNLFSEGETDEDKNKRLYCVYVAIGQKRSCFIRSNSRAV